MYAVHINHDYTVKTIVNQRIWRGYKLSDWFWFFMKSYNEDIDISKYSLSIEFTLPKSKKIIREKLLCKNELYNEHLKYTLLPNSKITNESGKVKAKVIFTKNTNSEIKVNTSEDETTIETSEFIIPISTRKKWHNDTDLTDKNNNNGHCCNCGNNNSNNNNNPDGSGDGNTGDSGNNKPDSSDNNTGGNCNCDSEEHIAKILSKTKPLVFESVAEADAKLNSGEITNIYYGQVVLIIEDDKYIPYTVQKGTEGYIVEPVDTVGDGLVWEEDI